MTKRVVAHFSCGAASAVATALTIAEVGKSERWPAGTELLIVNAFIQEEDEDNRRFLLDCQKWFGRDITVVRDEVYGASARQVWRQKRYIKNHRGAPCSSILKRIPIEAVCRPTDMHVYGFTIDEKNPERVARFLSHPGVNFCPLIEKNLTHADCRGMLLRAGIELPRRYRQGFGNANCKACCKGGEKYMRKTAREDPEDFAELVQIEAELGPGAYLFRDRETGERWPLTELTLDGPIDQIDAPDCSLFCSMAEDEMSW